MLRKLLIAVPVILALTLVSLFMPARQVTIEGIGRLSFETTVTLSVGSEVAYASPDWLSGWDYRRAISLSPATSVADYQVLVTLTTGIMGNPYANVKPDGSDIRFTGSDETTLQDYWVESWDNTGTSKIWVEVKTSGSSTIYMYYGNAAAGSASNGDATFDFFDDFEDGSQDWTIVEGSWSESTGILSVTRGTPPEDRVKRDFSDLGDNYAYEWKQRQYDLGGNGWPWAGLQIKSPTTDYSNYDQGYACYSYADGGTSAENQVKIFRCTNGGITQLGTTVNVTISQNTWYDYKITYNGGTIKFYVNDIERISTSDATYTTGAVIRLQKNNNDCAVDYDDVRIRKYTSPEPSATVGSEEMFPLDISNLPASKDFGTVSENSSYWSNDSPPTFPLDDGECLFTVTNNSSGAVDISIKATDFSGGVGWALAGSPDVDTVTLKAGKSGDALETDMVILTTSDQGFISSLAASDSKKWELKLETGTFTDGVQKTSTITLTATYA